MLHAEAVRCIFTISKTPSFCLRYQFTGSFFVFKMFSFASYLFLRKTFAVLKCNTFIAHVFFWVLKNVKLYCSVNTDDTCPRRLKLHHFLHTSFGTTCTSHSQLGCGQSILSQTPFYSSGCPCVSWLNQLSSLTTSFCSHVFLTVHLLAFHIRPFSLQCPCHSLSSNLRCSRKTSGTLEFLYHPSRRN